MPGRLDKPDHADDLYLARVDEVLPHRPLMTGDVFEGLTIPGVADEPGLGMLMTHPCSMRTDGVHLLPKLQVALVEPSETLPWTNCPRDRMPLPGLRHDEFHIVRFDLMGMITTSVLESAERTVCMTVRGINLLQQRLIWYFTRFEAPTGLLNDLFAPIFDEVDLQEEWVSAALSNGQDRETADEEFHEWIRADDGSGIPRQIRLAESQSRAMVRRALNTELRRRYGT